MFRPLLVFTPDGKMLAMVAIDNSRGMEVVRVHEIKEGLPVRHVLRVDGAALTVLAVSPCGRFVATGGKDWHVRLWRVAGLINVPQRECIDIRRRVAGSRAGAERDA